MIIQSTDVGTPSNINTVAGSYVTILDHCLVAAGWNIAFTATNRRAYKQALPFEKYVYVDDTDATNTRVRLFDSMTDINTGTNPTPTDAQISGGIFWLKQVDKAWIFCGDEKQFYFYQANESGTPLPSTAARSAVFVSSGGTTSPSALTITGWPNSTITSITTGRKNINTELGLYCSKDGASNDCFKISDFRNSGIIGGSNLPAPYPSDAGFILSPILAVRKSDLKNMHQLDGLFDATVGLNNSTELETLESDGGKKYILLNSRVGNIAARFAVVYEG